MKILNFLLTLTVLTSLSFSLNAGALWAFGLGQQGQLCNENNNNKSIPSKVISSEIKSIAAGTYFSILLKEDGSAIGYGSNFSGELGIGETQITLLPVKIFQSGVISVAAEDDFSFFAKNDGSVFSTGKNWAGQLGDDNKPTNTQTPVKIMSNGAIKVETGGAHSGILKNDGSVWLCGYNHNGQLGDGTYDSSSIPKMIIPSNVKDLSIGGDFTMILKEDGSVWIWGDNTNGQLGDGTVQHSNIPIELFHSGIKAIGTGDSFGFVIKDDGSLWGWGNNDKGQLGIGNTNNQLTPVQIITSNVKKVCGGYHHTLIITDNSELYACGSYLPSESTLTPLKIMDKNVIDIACGGYHSLVITEPCFNIKFVADENGMITGSQDQEIFKNENCSEVTAIPNEHYLFSGWSGDYTGTENPLILTGITSDKKITATFNLETFELIYSIDTHGIFTPPSNTLQTIEYGKDALTVEAVPKTGYHFLKWSDGKIENPRTDTNIKSNISVTAQFEENTYSITGTVSGAIKAGITITIDTKTTITDTDGNYIINELPAGSYSVTPSLNSYHFLPVVKNINIIDTDITNINFTSEADNKPPNGNPDSFVIENDKILFGDILINDNDPESKPLTAKLTKNPEHGIIKFNNDGTFSYTPDKNWTGTDSFEYKPFDGTEYGNNVTVDIIVSLPKITLGMSVTVNINTIPGIKPADKFEKAPKIYGTLSNKKLSLKKGEFTSIIASAIWSKKITLYDKKALKIDCQQTINTKKQAQNINIYLTGKFGTEKLKDVFIKKVTLTPPIINEINIDQKTFKLQGLYFGIKKPKVYLININDNKPLKLKVDKLSLKMNLQNGQSYLTATSKKDIPKGTYLFILDNKIGIGVKKDNNQEKIPLIIID
jgi:alpha-tubulin suppressor-like RCC1 family protein